MTAITFTSIEADVLRHRLCHLSEMDDEDLAELFPDHAAPGTLAIMAERAACQLKDGWLTVTIAHPDTVLVLVDAIEGSTHHEVAYEAEQSGRISRQKRAAYLTALATAAAKITFATGVEVKLP